MAFQFGGSQQPTSLFGQNQSKSKDFEVTSPPDDSISALAFSPATVPLTFLVAGSWDNKV